MTGNGDIDKQRATYQGLLGLMKWGGAISLVLALFVAWLLHG